MIYHLTSADLFQEALTAARAASPAVHAFTSASPRNPHAEEWRHYLSEDGRSGYAINQGYLACVFSLVPGRGAGLVASAILRGAMECDCYGTFLRDFYVRGGFRVVGSEAWDEDQFEKHRGDRETLYRLCGERPRYYFLER